MWSSYHSLHTSNSYIGAWRAFLQKRWIFYPRGHWRWITSPLKLLIYCTVIIMKDINLQTVQSQKIFNLNNVDSPRGLFDLLRGRFGSGSIEFSFSVSSWPPQQLPFDWPLDMNSRWKGSVSLWVLHKSSQLTNLPLPLKTHRDRNAEVINFYPCVTMPLQGFR